MVLQNVLALAGSRCRSSTTHSFRGGPQDGGDGKSSWWAEPEAVQLVVHSVWTERWSEVQTHDSWTATGSLPETLGTQGKKVWQIGVKE